jgi:hypothetical protein
MELLLEEFRAEDEELVLLVVVEEKVIELVGELVKK